MFISSYILSINNVLLELNVETPSEVGTHIKQNSSAECGLFGPYLQVTSDLNHDMLKD